MSDFDSSSWASPGGPQEYLDGAERFVLERATLLTVFRSFYRKFLGVGQACTMLDLGCGDGILSETVCSIDENIRVIAVDGSEDMLRAAARRLARFPNVEYRRNTFQELIANELDGPSVELVASSLAIHHLTALEKRALYAAARGLLKRGGYFVNIDVVLPACAVYEDWYYDLWREWIEARQRRLNLPDDLSGIPAEARQNPENHFQDVESQLLMLSEAGFQAAECFYRYGLFGIFGGRKP